MPCGKMLNIKLIMRIIGVLLVIEGVLMLTALPFSIYYSDQPFHWDLFNSVHDFCPLLLSAAFTVAIGGLLYVIPGRNVKKKFEKREGYIIVSLAWLIISIFGAIPFVLCGAISNYTDAFFETISGFTTTGATILTNVEAMPKGLLFWRSMTHWIGGMGIIVLSLAILPFPGIGGMQLFMAEVPGPTPDKLHPRITATAKRLWGIYIILTFVETVFLMLGGMSLFDGLCHAFGTLATGGFSTKNSSVADFSPYIQYVITVFMILAGTNFTLHYLALHGKLKEIWKNEEFRYYIFVIFISTIVITLSLIFIGNTDLEKGFRDSIFTVASIITTTGFVAADYLFWPNVLWFIIFLLMFVGGSAGSTCGGIKVVRQLLLFKSSLLELKHLIHPYAVLSVRLNGKPVSQDIILNILAFFLIYAITVACGTLVMTMMGLDFTTAIGATVATLGNVGPGIGNVGPENNFAAITTLGKWFLSFLMLLGRLELFTVLILFSPAFWKR